MWVHPPGRPAASVQQPESPSHALNRYYIHTLDVCNTERSVEREKTTILSNAADRPCCVAVQARTRSSQSRDIFILTLLSAGEYVYPAFNCRVVGNSTRHGYKYYNCNDGRRDWKRRPRFTSHKPNKRVQREKNFRFIDQNPGAWCDCRAPESDRVSHNLPRLALTYTDLLLLTSQK